MQYQRKPALREASQILTECDAAAILDGAPLPAEDEAWAVEAGSFVYTGKVGDYVEAVGPSWRVIPRAEFEAEWAPPATDYTALAGDLTAAADRAERISLQATSAPEATPALVAELAQHVSVVLRATAAILAPFQTEAP